MTKPTFSHPVLGQLERHRSIDTWFVSAPIAIPYLGGAAVQVTFCELDTETDRQALFDAFDRFLALPVSARTEAEPKVHADYISMGECCGFEDLEEIATPADVWDHAWPQGVYVQRNLGRDEKIYVSISFDCDWEQEHGLQLVLHEGDKLTRVSACDGHLT